MKRTTFDHTPDGLRERLRKLERQAADERRRGDAPAQYVEPAVDTNEPFTSGSDTIPADASSVVVSHNLPGTPLTVLATPRANEAVWVSGRSSTSFTLARAGTSGGLIVDWFATGAQAYSGLAYAETIAADTPWLWWPASDAASPLSDLSGNSRHGTASGGFTYQQPGPFAGSTAIEATSGSSVVANSTGVLNDATKTLEAWVKFPSIGSSARTVIGLQSGSAYDAWLYVTDTGAWAVYGSPSGHRSGAASNVTANVWYHVAAVFDGGNWRIVVNGITHASWTGLSNTYTAYGAANARLGYQASIGSALGTLYAHAAFYDYPLTDTQLMAHYEAGINS